MLGRINKKVGRGAQSIKNSSDFCVCPQCNYTFQHERGIPCKSVLCPDCKIYLVRAEASRVNNEDYMQNEKSEVVLPLSTKKSSVNLPKVNVELCIGCGACIDVCPMKAIVMVNGKANIEEEKCRNCRVCQRTCPVGAIS